VADNPATHLYEAHLCLLFAGTHCRRPTWLIVDSLMGGSGEAFDWKALRRGAVRQLEGLSTHGWLLAGGLTPETVAGKQSQSVDAAFYSADWHFMCLLPASSHPQKRQCFPAFSHATLPDRSQATHRDY
jgi:hypothetical protein